MSACAVLTALAVISGGPAARPSAALAAHAQATLGGFRQVATHPWLDHGRPVVLYVGAQYCPFCAAERWALVLALRRYGEWSGLRAMHSTAGTDGFPSIATYNWLHAAYRSAVIALQTREIATLSGQPLQALTAQQARAVNAYDPHGGIPFVLIAGRYAQISSGYSPSLLVGLSFARIHTLVYQQPTSAVGRAVTKEANVISALICAALGPRAHTTAACRIPQVHALLSKL
jgi:thiol-disulfide isomerase/thioredoxin